MSPTIRARYRLAPANKIKDVRAYLKTYRPEHLRYVIIHLGVDVEVDAEDLPDVHPMNPARRPYISIGFDRSITLLTMERIKELKMLVNSWTQSCVRRQPLDVELSSQIQFQTFSQERTPLTGQPEVDISRLESWIDELKKRAIEIVSYSFVDGMKWWFAPQNTRTAEYRRDCNVFRYSIYRRFLDPRANHPDRASRDQRNMLFAYQAPCILSKADLDEFVTMSAYPTWDLINSDFRRDFLNSSALRLWTKMWEVCRANEAHYFVISNYKNWVFGCYSPGFTAAYVSDVKSITDHSPTVLGYLSFWMASAASFQGSYKSPPKVNRGAREHSRT
ncbi:hypothetical protein BJ165DRAFT_779522 [Panaeolus papilionaceus]|nr:hypothetical protein BJ165DRAFT_779522 [Panaeolus papilionaceus]